MRNKKPIKKLENDVKGLNRGNRIIAHLSHEKGPFPWTFFKYLEKNYFKFDVRKIEIIRKVGKKKIKSSIINVYPDDDLKGGIISLPFFEKRNLYRRNDKGYAQRLKVLIK